MGFKLKSISDLLMKDESVSTSTSTKVLDISASEGGYAVQVVWENGSTVNMSLLLQASLDGVNFSTVDTEAISLDEGNHVWDIPNTLVSFIRVYIDCNGGSADFTVRYASKTRH